MNRRSFLHRLAAGLVLATTAALPIRSVEDESKTIEHVLRIEHESLGYTPGDTISFSFSNDGWYPWGIRILRQGIQGTVTVEM